MLCSYIQKSRYHQRYDSGRFWSVLHRHGPVSCLQWPRETRRRINASPVKSPRVATSSNDCHVNERLSYDVLYLDSCHDQPVQAGVADCPRPQPDLSQTMEDLNTENSPPCFEHPSDQPTRGVKRKRSNCHILDLDQPSSKRARLSYWLPGYYEMVLFSHIDPDVPIQSIEMDDVSVVLDILPGSLTISGHPNEHVDHVYGPESPFGVVEELTGSSASPEAIDAEDHVLDAECPLEASGSDDSSAVRGFLSDDWVVCDLPDAPRPDIEAVQVAGAHVDSDDADADDELMVGTTVSEGVGTEYHASWTLQTSSAAWNWIQSILGSRECRTVA